MVSILSLWLPIVLAAVGVFILSSIVHMVLPYHRGDFARVPDEDRTMDTLRPLALPPGEYMIPHCDSPKAMGSSDFRARMEAGPVAFFTVLPNGPMKMGASLLQWFAYTLVVGVFCAYLASRSLLPGAAVGTVFRFVATVAFIAYTCALWQDSIWYKRRWATTAKFSFDGLLYAIVTAVCFAGFWPR